jgi:DNA-binding GntR family transcriptional regulator
MDVQVPEFRSINYGVYSRLRKAIFEGEFAHGERIVEAEVSRSLGISRAPVREALHRLQQAGLVEHRPRRGWFAVRLEPKDMWDVYLVRAAIEGLAARRVATQFAARPPAELQALLDELQALIDKMLEAAEQDDVEALAAYDVRFHERILAHGGSNQLQRIWRLVHPQDWTMMSVLKLPNVPLSEMAHRHQAVLDAVRSGDPGWAEAVIRRHILELAQHFLGLPPEHDPAAGNIPQSLYSPPMADG